MALIVLGVNGVPFHCTVAALSKYSPVSVNVNAGPAAVILCGVTLCSTGTAWATVPRQAILVCPPAASVNTAP